MELALVPNRVVALREDGYYATLADAMLMEALAERFGGLTVFVPISPADPRFVSRLSTAVSIRPLPDRMRARGASMGGLAGAIMDVAGQFAILRRGLRGCSGAIIAQPSFYGTIASAAARLVLTPYGIELGGAVEGAAGGSRWARHRVVHYLFLRLFDAMLKRTLRGACFVVTHTEMPAGLAGTSVPVSPAVPRLAIGQSDLYRRTDTCQGSPIRLLSVTRLTPEKGIEDLLAAVHELRADGLQLVLTVIGPGEYVARLREIAAGLGLGEVVDFVGPVPNGPPLFRYYREADVYVMPSWREGFPRVLYEAAAHSLPIVSTNVGTISEQLTEGQQLLFVPPRSPESLAAAVRRVATDGELRRRLIRASYEWAEARLQTSAAAQFESLALLHFPQRTG